MVRVAKQARPERARMHPRHNSGNSDPRFGEFEDLIASAPLDWGKFGFCDFDRFDLTDLHQAEELFERQVAGGELAKPEKHRFLRLAAVHGALGLESVNESIN